jgi:hypothetical protein
MKVEVNIGSTRALAYEAPWPVEIGERVVVPVSLGGPGERTQHIWGEVVRFGTDYTGYCRPITRKRQPRDRQSFLGETVSS